MALDSIEIVMELEDEFGIRIPDEAAETLTTVGAIVDFVRIALDRISPRHSMCPTASLFYAIRRELRMLLPELEEVRIAPATELGPLLPIPARRFVWRNMMKEGLIRRSLCLTTRDGTILLCTAVAMTALGVGLSIAASSGLLFLFSLFFVPFITCFIAMALEPFRVRLPRKLRRVRDLVRDLPVPPPETRGLRRDQVRSRVRRILSEQLGVPIDEIHDESRLVQDLGMD